MLENNGPAPIDFVFDGTTYTIPENILCGRAISAVRRALQVHLDERYKDLTGGKPLNTAQMEIAYRLIAGALPLSRIEMAYEDERFLPHAMNAVCVMPTGEAMPLEFAQRICMEYPRFTKMVVMAFEASNLGNSLTPAPEENVESP